MKNMKNLMLVKYDPNISADGVHDYGENLAISDSKRDLEHYCKNIIKMTLLEDTKSSNGYKQYCVIEETEIVIV